MNLYDVTGAMGEALKDCQAEGIILDDRQFRFYSERVVAALKKLPPDPVAKRAAKLLACLDDEAANHGDLRITATKRAMGDLRLALNGRREE